MDVRLPDGRIIKNVPEGTTREQLNAKLGGLQQQPQAQQQPVQPRETNKILPDLEDVPQEVGRALGLTARAGIEVR